MGRKYRFTRETREVHGTTLHRIKALKSFGDVRRGELGGFIEKKQNLSQKGNCWVYDEACVLDNAYISDNACVRDNAEVYGYARVYGDVNIYRHVKVFDNARIYDSVVLEGNVMVYDYATVSDKARVRDNAKIFECASVNDNSRVAEDARIFGDAEVYGDSHVLGNADVYGRAYISGKAEVYTTATRTVFNLISGTYNVTLTDNHIRIGCKLFGFERFLYLSRNWSRINKNLYINSDIEKVMPYRKALVELVKVKMETNS